MATKKVRRKRRNTGRREYSKAVKKQILEEVRMVSHNALEEFVVEVSEFSIENYAPVISGYFVESYQTYNYNSKDSTSVELSFGEIPYVEYMDTIEEYGHRGVLNKH